MGSAPKSAFSDPQEQEIWQTVRAMNDAWTRGNPDDLRHYFHPRMLAVTATDRLRRDGADDCIAGWKAFAEAADIHDWREIDPLIRIHGDAAVVSYYYDLDCTIGGGRQRLQGRDLFFFVREGGRWLAVADQFSGYP